MGRYAPPMDASIGKKTQSKIAEKSPLIGASAMTGRFTMTETTTMITTIGFGITEPAVVVFRR